jgi:hypothetical protein
MKKCPHYLMEDGLWSQPGSFCYSHCLKPVFEKVEFAKTPEGSRVLKALDRLRMVFAVLMVPPPP